MKTRIILTSLLAASAVLFASCGKESVNNHDDLRAAKSLVVEAESFNLDWQADTLEVNWKANCYWGLEFLAWGNKVSEAGDTTLVLNPTKWMSTPVIYGKGDGSVKVFVDANARSNRPRTGYIKVFTGDENVCKLLTVTQAGNPDYVPAKLEPIDLEFTFLGDAVASWPTTSQSVGEVTYTLDGEVYTFVFGRCNYNTSKSYLVVHNADATLGLPVIENYKLTGVTVHVPTANTSVRGAKVTADTAGLDIVGDEQSWPATGGNDIVYELHDTDYNTMYYLYCTATGLPVQGLLLHYEP